MLRSALAGLLLFTSSGCITSEPDPQRLTHELGPVSVVEWPSAPETRRVGIQSGPDASALHLLVPVRAVDPSDPLETTDELRRVERIAVYPDRLEVLEPFAPDENVLLVGNERIVTGDDQARVVDAAPPHRWYATLDTHPSSTSGPYVSDGTLFIDTTDPNAVPTLLEAPPGGFPGVAVMDGLRAVWPDSGSPGFGTYPDLADFRRLDFFESVRAPESGARLVPHAAVFQGNTVWFAVAAEGMPEWYVIGIDWETSEMVDLRQLDARVDAITTVGDQLAVAAGGGRLLVLDPNDLSVVADEALPSGTVRSLTGNGAGVALLRTLDPVDPSTDPYVGMVDWWPAGTWTGVGEP